MFSLGVLKQGLRGLEMFLCCIPPILVPAASYPYLPHPYPTFQSLLYLRFLEQQWFIIEIPAGVDSYSCVTIHSLYKEISNIYVSG